jgi:hypothetical protein
MGNAINGTIAADMNSLNMEFSTKKTIICILTAVWSK